MSDVVRPCVLSKGGDFTSRPTLFHRVCCPKAVISCHARRCRPCVLSKGGDVMLRPTLFDCVCCLKAMMACHARRRSIVCVVQRH